MHFSDTVGHTEVLRSSINECLVELYWERGASRAVSKENVGESKSVGLCDRNLSFGGL